METQKKLTKKQIDKVNNHIELLKAIIPKIYVIDSELNKARKNERLSFSEMHKGTKTTCAIKITGQSKKQNPTDINFSIKNVKTVGEFITLYIAKLEKLIPKKIIPITKNLKKQNGKRKPTNK